MDWLAENPTILATLLVFLATAMFTVFAKVIISIFQLGVKFKQDYATKRDQLKFESEIRDMFREYKEELLKTVMSASMEMIREKLKEIKDIKEIAQTVKIIEKELEVKMKSIMERVDETKSLGDNIRSLNAKVDRLQYGESVSPVRRKEN
jgi:flagellar motility protein MotE (MotC chaperone)